MAGSEKVCEFSGKDPIEAGYDSNWCMYKFKHNLIQILPEYRSNFKIAGDDHVIYVFKTEHHDGYRSVGRKLIQGYDTIDYVLVVNQIELMGKVDGEYYNTCDKEDFSSVKRKLKKLLGARRLNIKHVPFNYYELASKLIKLKLPFTIDLLDVIIYHKFSSIDQVINYMTEHHNE